jgi:hypothetical protein
MGACCTVSRAQSRTPGVNGQIERISRTSFSFSCLATAEGFPSDFSRFRIGRLNSHETVDSRRFVYEPKYQ